MTGASSIPDSSSVVTLHEKPSMGEKEPPIPSLSEKDTSTSAEPSADSSSVVVMEGAGEPHEVDVGPEEMPQDKLQKIQTSEEGVEYPTGVKLALITLALCLSVFLMALDNTIIATAIPKITNEFDSLSDVGWYGSSYLLTTAAFQLLFGKMYSFFSIKWVYLSAIIIFELGSLVCGAAPNSSALIVGRAISGLGSSGIFSGALIIVAYSVPLRQRPMYTGAIGAMYGIASVAGPLLGGLFTDKATWRWCFYVNIPIGAITIIVIIIYFNSPGRTAVDIPWAERFNQLDLLGTAFFMPAIICLLLVLQWGGSKYEWSNPRIIVLFVLFGILIIVFMAIQAYKGDNATVPFRIMKQRSVAASCWYAFCLGSSFFIMIFYLPVWFQGVQNVSAVNSGIRSLPMVLGLVFVSLISGVGVSTLGYYTPWMIASSIIMPIGYGLITTFTPETSSAVWIGYQALAGIGVGLGMQQPMMAVQTVLDIKDVPTGTAVLIFLQTLGGALFVSVAQNIFSNKLAQELTQHVPSLDPTIVLMTGATSLQNSVPPEFLQGVILSYNNALDHAFTVATAIATASIIGSLLTEWKSVKGKKVEVAIA